MRFHLVAAPDQIAEGQGFAVEVEGRPVVLFRSNGTIYALDNLCPHAGSRLDQGRVNAGVISCPLHGAKFDLSTGNCRTPQVCGERRIVTHEVRIIEGQVQVALATEPMTVP